MDKPTALVLTPTKTLKSDSNFHILEDISFFNCVFCDKIGDAIFKAKVTEYSFILIVSDNSETITLAAKGLKIIENDIPMVICSPTKVVLAGSLKNHKKLFVIPYPCDASDLKPLLDSIFATHAQKTERKKVLIVDDIENNRKLISEYFKGTIVDADEASGGKEALEMIFSEDRKYDLVILDYQMPDMNGAQVLKGIRSKFSRKKLPVIIASAQNEIEVVKNLITIGAQEYLTKPIAVSSFFEKVNKVLKVKID